MEYALWTQFFKLSHYFSDRLASKIFLPITYIYIYIYLRKNIPNAQFLMYVRTYVRTYVPTYVRKIALHPSYFFQQKVFPIFALALVSLTFFRLG